MVYANLQYAWGAMKGTNQHATEVLKTRLCAIQILRITRSAVTDYLSMRGGGIFSSVAKPFVTQRHEQV